MAANAHRGSSSLLSPSVANQLSVSYRDSSHTQKMEHANRIGDSRGKDPLRNRILDKGKGSEESRYSTISSSCDGYSGPQGGRLFKGLFVERTPGEHSSSPHNFATLHSGMSSKRLKSVNDGLIADTDASHGNPNLKKRKFCPVAWDLNDLPTPPSDSLLVDGEAGEATSPGDFMENDDAKYKSGRELIRADKDANNGSKEAEHPEVNSEVKEQGTVHAVGNMLLDCRSVDEFERLGKINEGTYGVVYRARSKTTGEIVALKKVKLEKEKEGFPITSLREINMLLSIHHPSIVGVKEVVVGHDIDSVFMVMEYMEHDLKELMEYMKQPFSQSEVKCLMFQLLEGVKHLHNNWIIHRDLKTSNLLLNNGGEIKICDFGLARQYESPLKTYTKTVVTLWYRAPELLLGCTRYSTAVDMWALGCIMAELLTKKPLFNGKNELDQLDKIFKVLGTPNETIWPDFAELHGVKCKFLKQPFNKLKEKFPPTSFAGQTPLSESGLNLLSKLLLYDPKRRITVEEALRHAWFKDCPLPKMKELMPTFPPTYTIRREQKRRL